MQIDSTHIGYLSLHQGPQAGWVNYPFTEADLTSADSDKLNDVKSWLDGLNEPWSETSQRYIVHPSYVCGVVPEGERWICDYTSIVYDMIEAHVIAYGKTAEEAFNNCQKKLLHLLNDIAPQFAEDNND